MQLARTEVELAILAKEVTDAVTHVVAGVLLPTGAAILARQALTLVVSCWGDLVVRLICMYFRPILLQAIASSNTV